MPLLGDPSHAELIDFLSALPGSLRVPRAILIISAHWEAAVPSLLASKKPPLLYDYYGFPPPAYQIQYPVSGQPELAQEVSRLLKENNYSPALITDRGLDHGVFVPLKLMYPQAQVPCLQLSLIAGLSAAEHLRLGACLAPLREQGVMIIGSGMSFHNLQAIFAGPDPRLSEASTAFDMWLGELMSGQNMLPEERIEALAGWEQAPAARFCHPREEHLLPLMVCCGAAAGGRATRIYNRPLMGHKVSGFQWAGAG